MKIAFETSHPIHKSSTKFYWELNTREKTTYPDVMSGIYSNYIYKPYTITKKNNQQI